MAEDARGQPGQKAKMVGMLILYKAVDFFFAPDFISLLPEFLVA